MILKIFANLCRLLLGAVLIFSGFTKGVDPMGTAYKFSDYFQAFHLDFMMPFSLPLAILMNGAEFLIGIALICNIWMRFTAWMTLIFMSFFTILTFFLAIFNPVSDCGCFGDALKLSNWETFFKNIVLIIFAFTVFLYRKHYYPSLHPFGQIVVVLFSSFSFVWFSYYCYAHLPIIDFRPFKMGSYLPEQMTVPEGAPRDSFSTVLVYENKKTGTLKETDDLLRDSILWQDTATWKWKETQNKLIREGAKAPIHDFNIVTKTDEDITDSVLHDTTFSFLAVIPKLEKANSKGLKKLEAVYQYCINSGKCKFYALCASTPEAIEKNAALNHLTFDFYKTDETPLKTMVRSNSGLMLIKQGTVLGLWAHRDIPVLKEKSNLYSVVAEKDRKKIEQMTTLSLFLAFSLILSLLFRIFTHK